MELTDLLSIFLEKNVLLKHFVTCLKGPLYSKTLGFLKNECLKWVSLTMHVFIFLNTPEFWLSLVFFYTILKKYYPKIKMTLTFICYYIIVFLLSFHIFYVNFFRLLIIMFLMLLLFREETRQPLLLHFVHWEISILPKKRVSWL